ncbi:MAG: hypothetical protein IM581_05265 [Chitinophagaceae bacterium]|nr:hypothetical protein [Chitinophagaceae bacterium]
MIQHICCRPIRFVLTQQFSRNTDSITCQLFFERKGDGYVFSHYDAALIHEQLMPALTINQIVLKDLEAKMEVVDWKATTSATVFRLNDPSSWAREKSIEELIVELARLGSTPEGKNYADLLKLRFWSGTLVEQLTGSLVALRSRLEVSQRFYIVDGEGITVEEALRFLQNRWMEKRMQAKRKEQEGSENAQTETGDVVGKKGRKLIKKKNRAGA